MHKKGFSFIEILAPCVTNFGKHNRMGDAVDLAKFFHERSVIRNDIDPKEAILDFNQHLVVGKFVDVEKPTFLDNYELIHRRELEAWPGLESKVAAVVTGAASRPGKAKTPSSNARG
jgi:2-oxoglutarate/2-oxoacid ferredoxin oxidoreductase subunit beta